MVSTPELRTERLLLRGWRKTDLEPFAALNVDPEVTRYLRSPLTRAESDALRRVPGGDFDHPAISVGDLLRPHVLYRLAPQAERALRSD